MGTYTLDQIRAGWRDSFHMVESQEILGGHSVPNVDVLVDDGTTARLPQERVVLGAARLVWVSPDMLQTGAYEDFAVVSSRARFSGANRHRRGTIRSVSLFHMHRNDPAKLEDAALLAALVGVRNIEKSLVKCTEGVVRQLLSSFGYDCIQDVWARANSSPMPLPMSDALRAVKISSAHELGQVLRTWHDSTFKRLIAVNATPVCGGLRDLKLIEFKDVASRYSEGLNQGHGESDWKTLDRAGLEALVWEVPRSRLAERMGVSDVAIAKRCRREGIAFPPRGYWQRLDAGLDPRALLHSSQVQAPDSVMDALGCRFNVRLAA